MSQFFKVHPDNPQRRLIVKAVDIIRNSGVLAYPTDSCYALGCQIGDKSGLERICQIRKLEKGHNFTLICRNLSEAAMYAHFETPIFRLIKANTPGAYTFILRATKDVPRRLMHPKRKTIGLRIPNNRVTQALLDELNEPMLSTSLILPGDEFAITDPVEIRKHLEKQIDLVIDSGLCGTIPTTLIDLMGDAPNVLRRGKGDPSPFL